MGSKIMKYVVMPGGTALHKRAFDKNAVYTNRDEAEVEESSRNRVEEEKGNSQDEVVWFVCEWPF
jgi:hypothetical protein